MRSLCELLDSAVGRYASSAAVIDDRGAWTYAELHEQSARAAAGLRRLGVAPGDRVLSLLPGGRPFAATLYGAARAGAIVVPAAATATQYEVEWLVRDARPAVVVAQGAQVAERSKHGVRCVDAAALTDAAERRRTPGTRDVPSGDDIALLIYTSGTTSRPKGIICPNANVLWAAAAIADALGYQPDDVVFTRLPVSFDYGLYQLFLSAMAGAAVSFNDEPLSAGELHRIASAGATVLPVVPTYAAALSKLAARRGAPTSVRMITNTGDALVGADAGRLRAAFPRAALVCMYGMSECKRIAVAEPDEDVAHPGTVGRPLRGTEVSIVDDGGLPVGPGVTGQIVVTGPHVMAGYWQRPVEEAARFGPGRSGERSLFTGDYGWVDEDGRLFVIGRRDHLFKRRGLRTSCQEIEGAALEVDGVSAAACPPPRPDGLLTLWVVGNREPEDVLREVASRIGPAKRPDRCIVKGHLPRTPNGKVDRAALAASVEAR